jgi:hypothetical protein
MVIQMLESVTQLWIRIAIFTHTPQYLRSFNAKTLDYRFDNQAFLGSIPSLLYYALSSNIISSELPILYNGFSMGKVK